MIPAYLGIDIGTSGVRACCIDGSATELSSASHPIPLSVLDNGKSEQKPAIWWHATCEVIQAITRSRTDIEIKAIAIDGTSGTVLLTDNHGAPLSPALMYNDQRCLTQAQHIADIVPKDCAAHGASAGLAKLLYLIKRHPNAKYLCHQADWLSAKLTGQFGISDQNNCLKTGYDAIEQSWPAFMQALGVPTALLPEVVTAGTNIGAIQGEVASALGLSAHCHIIAGTTDSIAAFIATGANEIGTGVTSLGSSLSLKMITSEAVFSAEDGIYSHRLGDTWLVGGASNTGGRVLQQYFTPQQINDLSLSLCADKLTALKYYPLPEKGERFPINNPHLESCIEPKPENEETFFQALLEGITAIEKLGYKKLETVSGTKLSKIMSSGSGSTNTEWTKIRQNIIGVPVTQAQNTDASYGSALLAKQGHLER